ncbi:hypothetical protein BgiMline_012827, partial [Biomphalaria glabrata]
YSPPPPRANHILEINLKYYPKKQPTLLAQNDFKFPSRYNESGNVTSRYNESGNVTSRYNESGNVTSRYNESGNVTSRYNESGNVTSRYNESGNVTSRYNESGNVTSRYNESGNVTSRYNESGNVTSRYNESGNVTSVDDNDVFLIELLTSLNVYFPIQPHPILFLQQNRRPVSYPTKLAPRILCNKRVAYSLHA